MRLSHLSTKTSKTVSQADVSRNAQLLLRAGFVNRLMAGVYSFLPLGLRVLSKVETIIREEMNAIGGQEVLMPSLQPRDIWNTTDRWDKIDVLYKLKGAGDRDLALGPTHEEVVTPLLKGFLNSYKDFPASVYQCQTKFRNEARAKSGILRGREFRMKDMYSFHLTQECMDAYYEQAEKAYTRVFNRVGLGDRTLYTYASGGAFSKYSHEYQTTTPYGEDTIYKIPGTDVAVNDEVIADQEFIAELEAQYGVPRAEWETDTSIEVGNIFKLGPRFTKDFDLSVTDADNNMIHPLMGCYGIGISRLMGAVVEVLADDKGLVWPTEIAPYHVHLVSLFRDGDDDVAKADQLYDRLSKAGIEVLFDDRQGVNAGSKFSDADLIGCPVRVVISPRTLKENSVEVKKRTDDDGKTVAVDTVVDVVNTLLP